MNVPVRYGLILGVVAALISFVTAAMGAQMGMLAAVFPLVATVVTIVIVFLALRETAAEASWTGQLLNSAILGAVAAVIVFVLSWLTLGVVFPNYLAEMAAATEHALASAGLAPEMIEAQVQSLEEATAMGQSFAGAVGTIVTCLVAGAIIGIFKRASKEQ
ncbi:MAG: DUF4199 domain-containing protein [Gammaproteobacteria bacterium]|nr:DUF4199 domain-containing protein [Gammaproteobacteria bacterium]